MSTLEERLLRKAVDAAPLSPPDKAFASCRAPFGHDWDDHESQRNPEGGGWYLTMRCTKCGTVFKQIINPDGSLYSGRQYTYPKGYIDSDHWKRTEWRLNYLNKLNGQRR